MDSVYYRKIKYLKVNFISCKKLFLTPFILKNDLYFFNNLKSQELLKCKKNGWVIIIYTSILHDLNERHTVGFYT